MVEIPTYYVPSGGNYDDTAPVLQSKYNILINSLIDGAKIGDVLKNYREDALSVGLADVLKESNNILSLSSLQVIN